jgi:hypothetical protein
VSPQLIRWLPESVAREETKTQGLSDACLAPNCILNYIVRCIPEALFLHHEIAHNHS